ncbi:putative NADPH-dependent FMN reductase [Actinoplanes missouriensis 431]|uniref:Putative NADPH-dependent FMN reductase n=1 Tax=Actinoplanes missouriensis (strain ATCC 14538 / DSM 43046 / CBS 188.64 / JCM 3121 / NBRC 102363 / NCIMB 12654 / NRRL B-3342 / UNCC 431) TaxID=512565 RepID=I0GZL6_ACTM4|nr:NAD(P)H-dependent oxidoreductase [Actinoplanes missouriensis]BAL86203.1 putative NADPH-dependent FMN reductase [Actinoplanes missouriensis 431]
MTRVLLISGSTRDGSLHTAALRTAARHATAGITADLYDGLSGLPAFVPGEPNPPVAVTELRDRVTRSDALLVSTPEYAGSLPGSLKNLFDWLVDGGELSRKPVAWLSVVTPGRDDGARASLESVLEHGGARLLRPACVRIPLEMAAVDAAGLVTDVRLHVALQDMVGALVRSLNERTSAPQPSWQAHSSVYPVVQRQDAPRGAQLPPWARGVN